MLSKVRKEFQRTPWQGRRRTLGNRQIWKLDLFVFINPGVLNVSVVKSLKRRIDFRDYQGIPIYQILFGYSSKKLLLLRTRKNPVSANITTHE